MKSRYSVIDLFCGCGGASLGLKLAGHKIVAAVDIDPVACKTLSENLGLEPICGDLRYIDGYEILDTYGFGKDDIDLVVGCPPCQGFSSLRRTRYPDGQDPRKGLVVAFLERISEIQPNIVIFENVPGIAKGKGLIYLNLFLCTMEKMKYKINWDLINAVDFGVPQFRKRLIAICVKGATKPPPFPRKTHSNPNEGDETLLPWRTVRDAIGDLPPLKPGQSDPSIPNHTARNHSPKVLEIIRKIPKNGGSRKSLPPELWLPCHKKLKARRGGGAENVYGRMSWDKPSPTITCRCTTPSSGRFIHPEQDRAITPREAARLQSFPDDFFFPKELNRAERLIGNAVPPRLMTALVKSIDEVI
jgi:DNA (cytosine-5)-methyltransferase 1